MGRLFCLIGKSGSGKDTVFKVLMKDKSLGLLPVITYTTRPRREHETNGVEYYFINTNMLMNYKNADKIIEMRKYDTIKGVWYYCTLDDGRMDLNSANYIIIGTLEGYRALKKYYKNAVVPLYIEVDDGERLSRAIARERGQKKPDYSELCRRFLADCEDFSDEKLKEAGITLHFKNEVIEDCADEIKKYILSLSS